MGALSGYSLQVLSRCTPSGISVSIRGAGKLESQPGIGILLNCLIAYRVGDPTFYSKFVVPFGKLRTRGTNRQRVFLIPEAPNAKAIPLTVAVPARIVTAVIQEPVQGVCIHALCRRPPEAVVANDVVRTKVVTVAARKA